jgi:hypothetical protein
MSWDDNAMSAVAAPSVWKVALVVVVVVGGRIDNKRGCRGWKC